MRIKSLVLVLGIVAMLFGAAGSAGADPINAKNAEVITLDCSVNGTLQVVVNGNGNWTPGHAIGNNQVGVPYAFEFTQGGQTFSISKPAPQNGRLDVCTFNGTDEGGPFTATVWISYTPAH